MRENSGNNDKKRYNIESSSFTQNNVYPWFFMEPERVRISTKKQSRRVVLTQSKNCEKDLEHLLKRFGTL